MGKGKDKQPRGFTPKALRKKEKLRESE